MLKGTILAVIAGVLGAALWAAIAFYANLEIGWLAWGIGAGVGAGYLAGSGGGTLSGAAIAVVVTVISICGGKYAAVQMSVDKFTEEMVDWSFMYDSDEFVISYIADDVAMEMEASGRTLEWPETDNEAPEAEADYPAEVWSDALARWEAMPPEAQESYREDLRSVHQAGREMFESELSKEAFLASFGLFDVIFFLLAIVTAGKIASGGVDTE